MWPMNSPWAAGASPSAIGPGRADYQPKLHGRINRGPGPDSRRNNSIVIQHVPQRWMTTAEGGAAVPS